MTLHSAAHDGHLNTCKLIFENTPIKNPQDDCGMTLLDIAASNGYADI